MKLSSHKYHIFVNATGGIRASEPAADLAVVAALLSSFADKVVPPNTVLFGEVGLAGEVRRVSRIEARIAEAAKLGFKRVIVPASNFDTRTSVKGIDIKGITNVKELTSLLFNC